jgi:hypothetical protein
MQDINGDDGEIHMEISLHKSATYGQNFILFKGLNLTALIA